MTIQAPARPTTSPSPSKAELCPYRHAEIRASALELAAKVREKRKIRRVLLASWRSSRRGEGSSAEQDAYARAFWTEDAKMRERSVCARLWGLCRGFVEGQRYRAMEAYCRPGNAPSVEALADLLVGMLKAPAAAPLPAEVKARVERRAYDDVHDDVQAWLHAEPARRVVQPPRPRRPRT